MTNDDKGVGGHLEKILAIMTKKIWSFWDDFEPVEAKISHVNLLRNLVEVNKHLNYSHGVSIGTEKNHDEQ